MGDTAKGRSGYVAGDSQLSVVSFSDHYCALWPWLISDRMLAVMTMNTGYFISVLIGTFAGSVLLGAHTGAAGH